MAANLVKGQHRVIGFDLAPASREQAEADGVSVAGSASEAVAEAEIVVTMLPAGKHVLSVWSEILPGLKSGALAIDCSTIDVESARKAHGLAQERGLLALDAPVSGGVGGAKGATLTFMAGGSAEAFARAEPILSLMGRRVVHCGEAGAGQAAKICNNMILGATMVATCEGFALARKLGLNLQTFFDISSKASGQSWSMTSYCPVPGVGPETPADHDYEGGFAAALMLKDLKLAEDAAKSVGAYTPMGGEAEELFQRFVDRGGGSKDFSGIITMIDDSWKVPDEQ
jgi:3-hydroxyisobutyrate dehydrogenase